MAKKGNYNRKSYTVKQKMEVLEFMRLNEGSIRATSKLTGVNPRTIQSWKKNLGPEIMKADTLATIASEVAVDVAGREMKLLDQYFDLKQLIVDRMREILPHEKNLDMLQKTLKTLAEIGVTSRSKVTTVEDNAINVNYYQLISQHLNNIQYKPKSSIIDTGDTEE